MDISNLQMVLNIKATVNKMFLKGKARIENQAINFRIIIVQRTS